MEIGKLIHYWCNSSKEYQIKAKPIIQYLETFTYLEYDHICFFLPLPPKFNDYDD